MNRLQLLFFISIPLLSISLVSQISRGFCGQGLRSFRALDLLRNSFEFSSVKALHSKQDYNSLVEGYVFEDLSFPDQTINSKRDYQVNYQINEIFLNKSLQSFSGLLKAYFNYFDLNHEEMLMGKSLIVLFDNIRDSAYYFNNGNKIFSGYYDPKYEEICNRVVLVIDVNDPLENFRHHSTFIHESSHWVRHHFQPEEERWLEEGLAQWIEFSFMKKYFYYNLETFRKYPSLNLKFDFKLKPLPSFQTLEDFVEDSKNYLDGEKNRFSRNSINNMLFVHYLQSHLGGESFIKKILKSNKIGIENIYDSADPERRDQILEDKKSKSIPINVKQRYFFNNLFLNYQLALGLNKYKKQIQSQYDLWDLKLKELSPHLSDAWSVQFTEIQTTSKTLEETLRPWSANYYSFNSKCLSFNHSGSLLIYVHDPSADQQNDRRFFEAPRKKVCFSNSTWKELYVINWSDESDTLKIHVMKN